MRRGPSAGIAAALAIIAAAAVTAGCGGGSTSALSVDPVAAAATKTQHAGAARIRFAVSFSNPKLHGGKTLDVRGAGAIDGTSTALTFSLGGAAADASKTPLAHASVKEVSLEQNGDYVVYLGLGSLASGHLPGGKHWVELDLSKLGKSAGLDLGTLLSGSQLQPSDLLSMLEAEGAKVNNLGSATVDGAATTHYRVTIDPAKALQATGVTSPLLAAAATQLPSTIPLDVWIGKDNLVHRVGASLGTARGHLGLTMDVYDYGTHVTIAAPSSGDVFDATALAKQGFGSSFTH